jgi:hypothetical protein
MHDTRWLVTHLSKPTLINAFATVAVCMASSYAGQHGPMLCAEHSVSDENMPSNRGWTVLWKRLVPRGTMQLRPWLQRPRLCYAYMCTRIPLLDRLTVQRWQLCGKSGRDGLLGIEHAVA